MAEWRSRIKALRESVLWQIVEAGIYAGLLVLVCLYFTGSGHFIYEAF